MRKEENKKRTEGRKKHKGVGPTREVGKVLVEGIHHAHTGQFGSQVQGLLQLEPGQAHLHFLHIHHVWSGPFYKVLIAQILLQLGGGRGFHLYRFSLLGREIICESIQTEFKAACRESVYFSYLRQTCDLIGQHDEHAQIFSNIR